MPLVLATWETEVEGWLYETSWGESSRLYMENFLANAKPSSKKKKKKSTEFHASQTNQITSVKDSIAQEQLTSPTITTV
jgi:hypothetical protein